MYRKSAPVHKGVGTHHLTAYHPFDRNAQWRGGGGEEVSSAQLDVSVVFACLI